MIDMNIKEQVRAMVSEMQNINIKVNPIYNCSVKLRDALIVAEVPEDMANKIIPAMSIEVTETFMEDEEFSQEIIDTFAEVLAKIYYQSLEDDMPEYVLDIASKLDFNMNI